MFTFSAMDRHNVFYVDFISSGFLFHAECYDLYARILCERLLRLKTKTKKTKFKTNDKGHYSLQTWNAMTYDHY